MVLAAEFVSVNALAQHRPAVECDELLRSFLLWLLVTANESARRLDGTMHDPDHGTIDHHTSRRATSACL